MKTLAQTQPPGAPIVALTKWCAEIGISDTTGWRWRRDGKINPLSIGGKLYLTAEDVAQFTARAKAGEFAGKLRGAAARSKGGQP